MSSFEKVVIDAEMLRMMIKLHEEPAFSDEEFAFDALAEVGPGGHFFGCAHTLERYKDAFYEPFVSDWQNNESWLAAGGLNATERATQIWQDILGSTEAPAIDQAIEEELRAYVAKRKEEIGQGEP